MSSNQTQQTFSGFPTYTLLRVDHAGVDVEVFARVADNTGMVMAPVPNGSRVAPNKCLRCCNTHRVVWLPDAYADCPLCLKLAFCEKHRIVINGSGCLLCDQEKKAGGNGHG